jgi:hypothetical protein
MQFCDERKDDQTGGTEASSCQGGSEPGSHDLESKNTTFRRDRATPRGFRRRKNPFT